MSKKEVRNFDKLERTTHFGQMIRERNIAIHSARMAVEKGDFLPELGKGSDEVVYRLDFPGPDLYVVVGVERMKVEIAYWDDTQGAEGGKI